MSALELAALMPLRAPVPCWHESAHSARTDAIVGLNAEGAFLQTQRPLPVGTTVFLEILRGDERIEVDGEVIDGDLLGQTGFVVRFTSPERALLHMVDELLNLRSQGDEPFSDKRVKTAPFGVPASLLSGESGRIEVTERFIRPEPPAMHIQTQVELVAVDFRDVAGTLGMALPRLPSDLQLFALTPPMPQALAGQSPLLAHRSIPAPIEGWMSVGPEPLLLQPPKSISFAPTSNQQVVARDDDISFDVDVDFD
jgi:hypothetical protein